MSNPSPGPGPRPSSQSTWHIELRKILESYFDETELETLCFDLRVDYESLAGDSKTAKVVDLVRTFARTGRIEELIDYCSRVRPNVPWAQLRQAAASNPLVVDARPDEPGAPPPRTPPAPAPTPTAVPTPRPPRSGLMVGLVAVLVVALGVAAWRLFFPDWPGGPITPTTTTTTSTTSATTTTPAPTGFRVVALTLAASPTEYTGPCPVKITFSGKVSVAGGGGTVTYTFLRSDGATAPTRTLTFTGPGTQAIETTWTLGGATLREYSGWQAAQITAPDDWTTDKAAFRITCTG